MREDWRSVPLLETGTWLSGGTPATDESRYWDGDIPWISAASLKDFRIVRSDRCVTQTGALNGTRLVPDGTVLFVVRGMSLKSEFRVGVTEREVAFGQDCKAILPAPGIDARFLAFALKARERDILAMVDEAGHGTGRLPTDLIARLEIGVPDLAEQQRIVAILDSADATIDATRKVAEKLETTATALTTARLAELALGVTPEVQLGTLLVGIDVGRSPDLEDTPAGPGQWGVLKVSAVTNKGFRPYENKVVRNTSLYNRAFCVRQGDLLITRANTSSLVGQSCIVHDTPPGLMLCDKTLRLRVNEPLASVRYVHIALAHPSVRRQIENAATGTSGSMKNISQQSIRRLKIPVGSMTEMQRIVEISDSAYAKIDTTRKAVEKMKTLRRGMVDDLLSGWGRVPARQAGRQIQGTPLRRVG